jgi:hypothetical protein
MAPSEVARSMNLSARSVESHLTRARRHLRRMGALAVPVSVLFGWALRSRPGSRAVPAAMAIVIPVVIAAVVLLPSSTPSQRHPEPAPEMVVPAPAPLVPSPRNGQVPGSSAFGDVPAGAMTEGGSLPLTAEGTDALGDDAAQPGDTAQQPPGARSLSLPGNRALPAQRCQLDLPLLSELSCVLSGLVGDVAETPLPVPLPVP